MTQQELIDLIYEKVSSEGMTAELGNSFEASLPDGMLLSEVEDVQRHIEEFTVSATLASARKASEAMNEDPELAMCVTTGDIGRYKFESVTHRESMHLDKKEKGHTVTSIRIPFTDFKTIQSKITSSFFDDDDEEMPVE